MTDVRGYDDLSFYQVLRVSRNARFEEIETAYARIIEDLEHSNLALYSIVDDGEVVVRKRMVERAYRVLSDMVLRADYDRDLAQGHLQGSEALQAMLAPRPEIAPRPSRPVPAKLPDRPAVTDGPSISEKPPAVAPSEKPPTVAPSEQVNTGATQRPSPSVAPRVERPERLQPDGAVLAELEELSTYTGDVLRTLRESSGASLSDLEDITKISTRYLRAIEHQDFEALPAPVYIRGFVTQYAQALGLDPHPVSASYMALLDSGVAARPD